MMKSLLQFSTKPCYRQIGNSSSILPQISNITKRNYETTTENRYYHHKSPLSLKNNNNINNKNNNNNIKYSQHSSLLLNSIPKHTIHTNPKSTNINNNANNNNININNNTIHNISKRSQQYSPRTMTYSKHHGVIQQDLERARLQPTPEERVKSLFPDVDEKDLVEVQVNDIKLNVPSGVTVLQACEAAGINIPRFCYHDRLSIAGNCRMCLVEVEKAKKPVASCANPIMPGMKIRTDTEMVKFAREGVVEFLLANHPLDCPICDQGGECDLQDISGTFGSMQGRYNEDRRPVEDKDIGPFVKTVMTRCIHCTRCVRFADEIAGNEMLGTTGRGNSTEIGTYIESYFDTELSGNVVDLCPVGALTNRTSAFKVRPWDLTVVESIDVLESTCANLVFDTRFNELIRIKPRLNEDVNEEWISDKTRFVVDGLKRQRLDMPLVKDNVTNNLQPVTWPEAMEAVSNAINERVLKDNTGNNDNDGINSNNISGQMKAIAGDLCDLESMVALKDLFNSLGSNNTECRQDNTKFNCDIRNDYLFNTTISGMEYSDLCLLIGTNPRMEAPLINARLRKCYLNGLDIYLIGNDAYLNYPKEILGNNLNVLQEIINGNNKYQSFIDKLNNSENPMIIFGLSCFENEKYNITMSIIDELIKKFPNLMNKNNDWNGINILQTRSSKNGAYDVGFIPGPDVRDNENNDWSNLKILYLLGADEFNLDLIPENCFVIYQGSHGDRAAKRANVILPGCSYVEKSGTYVNIDGRVQRTKSALTPPGQARVDWQIIRALSEVCGNPLNYNNINELRDRMYDIAPHLQNLGKIEYSTWKNDICGISNNNNNNNKEVLNNAALNEPFNKYFDNYFATDHISRSSVNLQKGARDLTYSANSWV